MAVGKRIYLKRHMPDHDVMMQFKNIPASNTCDVMGRNAAMNPRIHLVSQPKEQMAVGPALTVKPRRTGRIPLPPVPSSIPEAGVCGMNWGITTNPLPLRWKARRRYQSTYSPWCVK